MRNAWLVAFREYLENVKTKGFWIGIFIFPLLITVSLNAEKWLEKAKPTRHFVVVDDSGKFDAAIETALDRLHQRKVLETFGKYVKKYAKTGSDAGEKVDLENVPAIDTEKLFEKYASTNPEMVEAFVKEGGIEMALGQLKGRLKEDAPPFEQPKLEFKRVPVPSDVATDGEPSAVAEALKPYLRGDRKLQIDGEEVELFAALIVPHDIEQRIVRPGPTSVLADLAKQGVQYWAVNLADDDLKDEIERAVNEEQRRLEYVGRGMDATTVREVQRTYVPFASLDPKKEAGEETVSMADQIRQWAPVGFVYLLWISIFTIAQMLLNNTVEEKSNRLIEVLLSSVTPGELMLGKLAGIAAVGLTMIASWIGFLVTILVIKSGPEAEIATQLLTVLKTSGLLPAFAAYFVLGYLLYGGIFMAIGSVCNTLKEAQNMMGPVIVILIVPLITMGFIPKDPNGTLATVMSWIPVYTPFVMMNRAAASPPMVEIVGTTLLLAVSVVVAIWLSAKVFRTGILRTGQPPKLFELLRWVRG